MNDTLFAKQFAHELEAEAPSTIKCLERIPAELFGYKPHPTSMELGYLAMLVAEIPLWMTHIIKTGEINFATFQHIQSKNGEELVAHFKNNVADAKEALLTITDNLLSEPFYLKKGDEVLLSSTKHEQLESTINHLVHHRGQLTVYMRLNEIAVPAIYGPSADDKSYGYKANPE